jgi:hypothetical protein
MRGKHSAVSIDANMQSTEKIAIPRQAATVVLLREVGSGLEVLMLQRLASMAFAGGDWVFPGGAVDAADSSEQMLRCTSGGERVPAGELAVHIAALLIRDGLFIDQQDLALWSHWITPTYAPRRFDTHFFVAAMPVG